GDVGDQGAEVLRGEGRPVLPGPAGEQVQPPAGDRDEVPYLVGQDGVGLAAHPVEDDDVAVRVLLQQGPDGGDAHPAGDQQGAGPGAVQGGEGAVGALQVHAAADREVPQSGAGGADGLGGQAQRPAVGGRRQRERVRGPPVVVPGEPPDAELAGPGGQPVETVPGDV